MIFMVTTWYPPDKYKEIMEKTIEIQKKGMPTVIKKWQTFGTAGGDDGYKTYNLIMTDKDKAEEAVPEIAKILSNYNSVEGHRYKIEVLLGIKDTIKLFQESLK